MTNKALSRLGFPVLIRIAARFAYGKLLFRFVPLCLGQAGPAPVTALGVAETFNFGGRVNYPSHLSVKQYR